MKTILFCVGLTCAISASAQLPLEDLKAFEVGKNWQIAGNVRADFEKDQALITEKGSGILVNLPDPKRRSNLLTKAEYGDMDISTDFMMAKHSNSGIYLMGRYEVQLLDSWGVKNPRYGDLGGIYQRRRPDGSQFEGHAPRINASKAPGTWQHIFISFRAPRFDESGNKTENARILKVVLNGFTIHENVELTGPTGGPISEQEAAKGPIMIQGDHGPVAFRNMIITEYEDRTFSISDLQRTLYKGEIQPLLRFNWEGMEKQVESVNAIDISDINEEIGWATVFKGKINIPEDGEYLFSVRAGGESQLKIDEKEVVSKRWSRTQWEPRSDDPVFLTKGIHSIQLTYSKVDGWLANGLVLYVESKELRRKVISKGETSVAFGSEEGPVYIVADVPRVVRSFQGIEDSGDTRVLTHIVNVGSPNGLHYSYDTSTGRLVKIWRGNFLDASPMWNGRGNARAVPRGIELLLNADSSSPEGYRSLGYDIDPEGYPLFRYRLGNKEVIDKIRTDGKTISRSLEGAALIGAKVVILRAESIEYLADSMYSINDKQFFITSDQPLSISRDGDQQVLAAEGDGNSVNYKIIW